VVLEYETFEWKLRICTGHVHKEMFYRNINRVNVSLDILNTFLFIRFLPDVLAGFVEFLGSWAKIQP